MSLSHFWHITIPLAFPAVHLITSHYNTPALHLMCIFFWQKPAITFPLSHPLSERASPFQHHLFSSHDMPHMIMSKRFKTRLKIFRKSIQHTSQKRKKLAETTFQLRKMLSPYIQKARVLRVQTILGIFHQILG